MKTKVGYSLIAGILFSFSAMAQKTIDFVHQSFDEILHRAKTEQKPVMMYFTGTGCSLCVKMERNTFTQPAVYELFNESFINTEFFNDNKKPDSAQLALRKKYNIISQPTFLFVNGNGDVIHKSGYRTTDEFIQIGQQAKGNDNYANWKKQLDNGHYSPALVNKILSVEDKVWLFPQQEYNCTSQKVLDQYFSGTKPTDYTSPDNWNIIQKYVFNPYSDVFRYLVTNQDIFMKQYGKEAVTQKIYDVYSTAWSGIMNSIPYKKAEEMVKTSKDPIAQLLVTIKNMQYEGSRLTREEKPDWKNFVSRYDTLIKEYSYLIYIGNPSDWADDICKKYPSDKHLITTANHWMKKMLSDPENEDYDYYEVYAKSLFLLGDKKAAADAQKKALVLCKQYEMTKEEMDAMYKALQKYEQ